MPQKYEVTIRAFKLFDPKKEWPDGQTSEFRGQEVEYCMIGYGDTTDEAIEDAKKNFKLNYGHKYDNFTVDEVIPVGEECMVHIHGQELFHAPAYLVVNRAGAEDIIKALQQAILTGSSKCSAMVSDGEGYTIYVKLVDGDFGSDEWDKQRRPYTVDYAVDNRDDAEGPHEGSGN
jgi:hypothetical protein